MFPGLSAPLRKGHSLPGHWALVSSPGAYQECQQISLALVPKQILQLAKMQFPTFPFLPGFMAASAH